MTVVPSCPALVVHDDDAFRRSLIASLDQNHFTVTVFSDGPDVIAKLKERRYKILLLGVDLTRRRGLETLEFLKQHRSDFGGTVIILGDSNPELRSYASAADETLLKPVDPNYVATRARVYCGH
jgi:DNA-binding response OmpR family regulator